MAIHKEDSDLGNLLTRLPIELHIDVYERVFNASFDSSLMPHPLKPACIQREMLCTLHIDRTIQ